MPLDEDIKGSHGEGEAGVEVLPDSVHDFLEMAHDGQHGEHRLDEHTVLPLAPLTQFEIRRVHLGGMEGGITQDRVAGKFVRKYTLRHYSCFFKEIEGKSAEFSPPS